MQKISVSAIIPTFRRTQLLISTISRIKNCCPAPNEILVHIDAGDSETDGHLRSAHPDITIISSQSRQGPGGGRNLLVEAARNEYIASFDDDSWPVDGDYFASANQLLNRYRTISLFACNIIEADRVCAGEETLTEKSSSQYPVETTSFGGGGCFFRKSRFQKTGGYVPLENAYGMEESDVSLKLIDAGEQIGFISDLFVYHDCDRKSRHAQSCLNAAQIRNIALLAYLRYPIMYWPYGAAQVLNRVWYCLKRKRCSGIGLGLCSIPAALWKNRAFRHLVKPQTVERVHRIRRAPAQILPYSE